MEIVIIGNGISGITAARNIRKRSDHRITVISSETEHFYSRTALMYIYMGHMRFEDTKPYEDWFWRKNKIDLLMAHVEAIDFKTKELALSNEKKLSYDHLILALGSTSNKFGWPGQDLERVYGLYQYQDLQAMERFSKGLEHAVIVGGGLIGIEMAEMFHSRHIPVTILVREQWYWDNVLPQEEAIMVSKHIEEHGIVLKLKTELQEIVDDGHGNACAVVTNKGEKIDCGFVGLTAGVHPNVAFLKNSGLEINRGILVDDYLKTNVEGVYAVGDCAELRNPKPGRRAIEAVWYTGRMMGETVAHTICGNPVEYDPGIWFNSAKFLDIEYQVYGEVPRELPEDLDTLYWEHIDSKKAIRINYDKKDGYVRGFNLMGIRYRHEICDKWIKEKTHIEEVLKDLKLANFDPEFYRSYENDVLKSYEAKTGTAIRSRKKRSLDSVLKFLNV